MRRFAVIILPLLLLGSGCSFGNFFEQTVKKPEAFVVDTRLETHQNENLEAELRLPVTGDDQVDRLLQLPVERDYQEFVSQTQAVGPVELPGFEEQKNGYWVSYEVLRNDADFFSLMYTISTYHEGAAHPNHTNLSLLLDRSDNTVVPLETLFKSGANYAEALSRLAIEDLMRQAGDEMASDTESAEWQREWFADGAGPEQENFQHFGLNEAALVLYFPPYQVAAYAEGTKIVTIPLEDLHEILRDDLSL